MSQQANKLSLIPFSLKVQSIGKKNVSLIISKDSDSVEVIYTPENEVFTFNSDHVFSVILERNQLQLKKITKTALKSQLNYGQQVRFAFIPDFPFLKEEDFNHFIRLDSRNGTLNITVSKEETNQIYKLYADGSFGSEKGRSAYAGIIIHPEGHEERYHAHSPYKSSNRMELRAVIEGLKRLKHIEPIQVNTDSRYVIRGLTQWMHFWKLNNWHTAQGTPVKYKRDWQELDFLTRNNLIELRWIKAHSGDEYHTQCHQLAKQIATQR
jgi:ribonuclease HI